MLSIFKDELQAGEDRRVNPHRAFTASLLSPWKAIRITRLSTFQFSIPITTPQALYFTKVFFLIIITYNYKDLLINKLSFITRALYFIILRLFFI